MSSATAPCVLLLYGGKSPEHEVSIQSGLTAAISLAVSFRVLPVYIDRDGLWHLPAPELLEQPAHEAAQALVTAKSTVLPPHAAVAALQTHAPIAAFLGLHGPGCEDGTLQGFLQTAGVPYTGSGVLGSALAMDKRVSKSVYAASGFTMPRSRVHAASALRRDPSMLRQCTAELGLPLVVKPVGSGSSVGTGIAAEPDQLEALVRDALRHGTAVLFEEYIAGDELTCGVLELGPDDEAIALPPTLIRPRTAEFFDYRAKYEPGASEEITPAPIPAELTRRLQSLALRAHRVLDLGGYSRSAFIARDGELYILETNTLPGLTGTSLFPQAAAAAGIGLEALLRHLVRLAAGQAPDLDQARLTGCLTESEAARGVRREEKG